MGLSLFFALSSSSELGIFRLGGAQIRRQYQLTLGGSRLTLEYQQSPPSMNQRTFLSAITIFATALGVQAATLSVLPNTSIQTKIDLAKDGDVIAIFGGTYNEDITINKAIRLVEVSGQDVVLTGNVTFSGVTNAPSFEGFTQGSSGRSITVNNTTGLVLRNVDAKAGTGINATGTSNIRIVSCQSSAINTSATMLEIVESTTTGRLTQTAGTMHVFRSAIGENIETSTGALKTVAFRTTVSGDNNWRSKKAWFGYCDTRSFNFHDQTGAKVVVVGCRIDRQGGEANGIYLAGSSNSYLVANNSVIRVNYGYSGDGENGLDGRGSGNSYLIANNYFQLQFIGEAYYANGARGDGIYVRDSSNAKILNNTVVGARYGVSALFGATAKNNLYWASPWNNREANGVVAEGTLYTDPKFVTDQAPTLAADSPCVNAGVADPIYNNRDGTRNTIGPSGGTLYDPDARTTENPVVISFDLGPEQVLEGEDTSVTLSNGQAVSQP
ncbi:MAG: hypothetical protein ACOYOL_06555 [Chthoniobacterales bacterium]